MSNCYINELGTYAIALRLLSKNNEDLGWADEILDVVDELRNVFEPLSADLIIESRDKSIKWRDKNVKVTMPTWFIRVSSMSENIVLEPSFSKPQVSEVTELSREALMRWIENALNKNRNLPETYEPGLYNFSINAVRARIFDENIISDPSAFFVEARAGVIRYPLEKKTNIFWVYAPIKYYTSQPPLSLQVSNTEGALRVLIHIDWSLWSTPGTAENTALRQALSRIVNKGWTLTHAKDVFQI